MANLKAGTLLAGNLIWHAGNMPIKAIDNTLLFKDKKIYSEWTKPTPDDVGAVARTGDTMTGVLSIATIGNNTFSVRTASNKNSSFIMGEDDDTPLKHGFYIKYTGAVNTTSIGTRLSGADIDSIILTGGNSTVTFLQSPIISSSQSTAANSLTRKDYVDTKVMKAGDIMTGKLTINSAAAGEGLLISTGSRNGGGASIKFSDVGNNVIDQVGILSYYHFDDESYGGDSSFHFSSSAANSNVVLLGEGNYKVGNHEVYHEGHKPTASEVGALPSNGKAVDSDKLDGLNSSQFIRSDVSDSMTGTLTATAISSTLNHDKGYFTLRPYDTSSTHSKLPGTYVQSYMTTRNNIAEWDISGRNATGTTKIRMTVDGHFYSNDAPTASQHMTNKGYVDGRDNMKVNKAGDTMTGRLTANTGITLGTSTDNAITSNVLSTTNKQVIGITTDSIHFGNKETEFRMESTVTPTVSIGSNTYSIYHEGHKPTTAELNVYTKTESDSRFVNATGDTMTGNLVLSGVNSRLKVAGINTSAPIIDLAIGDTDTGFNYKTDGSMDLYANNSVIANYNTNNIIFNADLKIEGHTVQIRDDTPYIWFNDTTNAALGCSWYTNSDKMYLLRHQHDNAAYDSGPNGRHPATIDLINGDSTISGQSVAYYTGSKSFSEQKNTKASFYTELSTAGSSEYHPMIKQKVTKTGANADTWNYSFGQLIANSSITGMYVYGQRSSDNVSKSWTFSTSGSFIVGAGGINLNGSSRTTGKFDIDMNSNGSDKWTDDNLVIQSFTPIIRMKDKSTEQNQILIANSSGRFCVASIGADEVAAPDKQLPTMWQVYHEGHKPTASEVGAVIAATANTIALRDNSADISARLFRSNYENSTTMSGAIAYRGNNSSDNYIKYCSSNSAVRSWLDTYSKGEADGRYVNTTGDVISGNLKFRDQGEGIEFNVTSGSTTPTLKTSGSWITGGHNDASLGKINNVAIQTEYGFSVSPSTTGHAVSRGNNAFSVDARTGIGRFASTIYANGNKQVYHEGHKPTPSEIGSYTKIEADNKFVNITGDRMTGPISISTSGSWPITLETSSLRGAYIEWRNAGNQTAQMGADSKGNISIRANTNSISFDAEESRFGKQVIVTGDVLSTKDISGATISIRNARGDSQNAFWRKSAGAVSGSIIKDSVVRGSASSEWRWTYADSRGIEYNQMVLSADSSDCRLLLNGKRVLTEGDSDSTWQLLSDWSGTEGTKTLTLSGNITNYKFLVFVVNVIPSPLLDWEPMMSIIPTRAFQSVGTHVIPIGWGVSGVFCRYTYKSAISMDYFSNGTSFIKALKIYGYN